MSVTDTDISGGLPFEMGRRVLCYEIGWSTDASIYMSPGPILTFSIIGLQVTARLGGSISGTPGTYFYISMYRSLTVGLDPISVTCHYSSSGDEPHQP